MCNITRKGIEIGPTLWTDQYITIPMLRHFSGFLHHFVLASFLYVCDVLMHYAAGDYSSIMH